MQLFVLHIIQSDFLSKTCSKNLSSINFYYYHYNHCALSLQEHGTVLLQIEELISFSTNVKINAQQFFSLSHVHFILLPFQLSPRSATVSLSFLVCCFCSYIQRHVFDSNFFNSRNQFRHCRLCHCQIQTSVNLT